MKKEFIKTLIELARKDKDIYLLTGDLGFSLFEDFAKEFPERFINCGVAEQNMAGMAAGLALEGKKPYIYSIVPFITFRCLEQIRNDICYQNLNVKIIGVGAGFSYGSEDFTHYGIEDISALRSFPNLMILSPADLIETKELVLQSYLKNQPTYIRLDKSNEIIHLPQIKIEIGKPLVFSDGKDGVVITTGTCLKTAISVAKKIKEFGISLKVVSIHTIKPINENLFIKEIEGIKKIFTLEEHSIIGGLGSVINEILAKNNIGDVAIRNIGVADNFKNVVGDQSYLKKYHKIDTDSVYKIINNFISKNGK